MSADNGIYILKTINAYRVKHILGFDNIYWDDNQKCDTNSGEWDGTKEEEET